MNKKILIVSLEGIESNTEVNFFQGLGYHLNPQNCTLLIMAIGKQGKNSKTKKKKIEDRIEMRIKNIADNLENLEIFFIGDGDKEKEIEFMEESKKTFINFINKKFGQLKEKYHFNDNIIYEKDKSFDLVLKQHSRLKNSNLINFQKHKNQKKESNKLFFNNIIDQIKETKIIEKNMIEDILKNLFKNTNYIKIINIIYN